MSWDDLCGRGVDVALSPLDSDRFGVRVVRAVVRWDEVDQGCVTGQVASALDSLDPDIAVVRWPAHLTTIAGRLVDVGRPVVPADTLVYWSAPTTAWLSATEHPLGVASLAMVRVALGDVEAMVRDTFLDYPSHHTASAVFDTGRVLDGYVDWAGRLAEERPEDCIAVLGEGGRLIALATTQRLDDSRSLEVLLAGTAPGSRGRGWYQRLFTGVAARAAELGCPEVVISTQSSNVAVQRAWVAMGLRPFAAFSTVHVRRRPQQ